MNSTMPGRTFVVNLIVDGGDAGEDGRCATYTYTVIMLDGVALMRGATPERPRVPGRKLAAKMGFAFFGIDGDPVLMDVAEGTFEQAGG